MAKKIFFSVINGGSMNPLILSGDAGIFEKTAKLKLFDVCIFRQEKRKKLITHRLVRIYREKLLFHGDNSANFFECRAGFELIPKSHVNGRLIGIIRKGKKSDGTNFRIRSYWSLICSLIKMLPFIIKKYWNKFI